jgi:hypothetical protein
MASIPCSLVLAKGITFQANKISMTALYTRHSFYHNVRFMTHVFTVANDFWAYGEHGIGVTDLFKLH